MESSAGALVGETDFGRSRYFLRGTRTRGARCIHNEGARVRRFDGASTFLTKNCEAAATAR